MLLQYHLLQLLLPYLAIPDLDPQPSQKISPQPQYVLKHKHLGTLQLTQDRGSTEVYFELM